MQAINSNVLKPSYKRRDYTQRGHKVHEDYMFSPAEEICQMIGRIQTSSGQIDISCTVDIYLGVALFEYGDKK